MDEVKAAPQDILKSEKAEDAAKLDNQSTSSKPTRKTAKMPKAKKKSKTAAVGGKSTDTARTRTARPYPATSFNDALPLGDAIMKHAAGEKVRRLTLLGKMDKSPNSSATHSIITNSSKYGITSGSYVADYLELTDNGKLVVDANSNARVKLKASFALAVDGISPFKLLYDHYKDKRLPERDVVKDFLKDSGSAVSDLDECVDTFTVNVKDLGLLRTIGGAETLISIEQALEELPISKSTISSDVVGANLFAPNVSHVKGDSDWDKICFYITPIGGEESEPRKHSDLFLSSLVRPALEELGLTVVRADEIGEPGMITSQVLEYLRKSRLAIADLSYLNPNVFYEVALRHALKLPVVQLIRKADRLPFDVNQLRTLVFDTSDIYSLVPKLQTYRAEIANQARMAIENPESIGNPISVFYPDFYK